MSQQTNSMSLRVTIHAGPRTKIKVSADAISVNEKHFKLANGEIVTSTEIENYIKVMVEDALKKVEQKEVTK